MTCVFVPQDLAFLRLDVSEMHALNPRLVPLIAHDRAGFGGAVLCCGLLLGTVVWWGQPSRTLWWVLALFGLAGFGAAIGAHPAVGYDDPVHLAPALTGLVIFVMGMLLTYRAPGTQANRSAAAVDRKAEEIRNGDCAVPSLAWLGSDLLRVSRIRVTISLALPFLWSAAYFIFAVHGWWPAAGFSLIALSFVTYGSVSHDLVHGNLALRRGTNDILLCVIELLALRSGHVSRRPLAPPCSLSQRR
jgi:hypothetical protein